MEQFSSVFYIDSEIFGMFFLISNVVVEHIENSEQNEISEIKNSKRGRKPKNKTEDDLIKDEIIKKKRGRKPSGKVLDIKNIETKIHKIRKQQFVYRNKEENLDEDNIIKIVNSFNKTHNNLVKKAK